MDGRKIAKIGIILSVGFIMAISALDYLLFFSCHTTPLGEICFYKLGNFVEPLFILSVFLIPIFAALYFTHKKTFITWKKFAVPYLVLSVLILLLPDKAVGNIGPSFDNEFLSFALSILFFMVSIGIIVVQWWRLRGR